MRAVLSRFYLSLGDAAIEVTGKDTRDPLQERDQGDHDALRLREHAGGLVGVGAHFLDPMPAAAVAAVE